MMTKFATTLLPLALSATLAACGSSGSTGAIAPAPTPEVPGGPGQPNDPGTPSLSNPTSNAVADLLAFAQGGSKYVAPGGVARLERETADGRVVSAAVLEGTNSGYVKVEQAGTVTAYTLAGAPIVTADTPGGVFTGDFEASYRMGASQPVLAARGDGFIELDMASGQAYMDSLVSNRDNNILVLGTMQYADGRLAGNGLHVQVRDGAGNIDLNGNGRTDDDVWGNFGNAEAILVDNANGTSIIGVMDAQHESGFQMDGGFVVNHDPSRTIGNY